MKDCHKNMKHGQIKLSKEMIFFSMETIVGSVLELSAKGLDI